MDRPGRRQRRRHLGAAPDVPGLEPEIDAAAGRLVVLDTKPDGSGDLELRDLAAGTARVVSTGQVGNDAVPIGHPDGTVSVIWQGAEDNARDLAARPHRRQRAPSGAPRAW